MICLYCGGETKVTNSRLQNRNNQVWRRRECLECKAVFTTHEAIDLSSSLMVESHNTSLPFLTDKLFADLLFALQDRSDRYLAAREVSSTVVAKLLKLPNKPIFKTEQISELAGNTLKHFDKRAHLRYVADHPSLQT